MGMATLVVRLVHNLCVITICDYFMRKYLLRSRSEAIDSPLGGFLYG